MIQMWACRLGLHVWPAARQDMEQSTESTQLTTPVNTERKQRTCQPLKFYFHRVSSRALPLPVVLLVFYVLPCVLADVMIDSIIQRLCIPLYHPLTRGCYELQPLNENVTFWVGLLVPTAIHTLVPISGGLSDAKIGRKQTIYFALWMGWAGTLLQTLSECFQYHYCGVIDVIGRFGLSSLALVFLTLSFTMFLATSLSYGMDLLMDSSSTKYSSFIYWYSWMFFLGGKAFSVVEYLPGKQNVEGKLALSFSAFFFFSVSLLFYFIISWQLQENLNTQRFNPYMKIFRIFKYSLVDHKREESQHHQLPRSTYRSAYTYWEDASISKLDIAKSKYGGPYSQEEVENVKTFFRILLVLLAVVPFVISTTPVNHRISKLVPQLKGGDESMNGYAQFYVRCVSDNLLLLAVPILEFLVVPFFPKLEYFLVNSLKGIGLSQIFLIFSIITVFVIDLLVAMGSNDSDIPYQVLFVPSLFSGIAYNIFFVCVFQFICSQSPYELSGMIIGIFWVLRSCCNSTGLLFDHIIDRSNTPGKYSCTLWFFLLTGGISSLGLLLYIPTARWYTKRVRTDNLSLRRAVEDHFEQQIARRPSFNLFEESEV